MATARWYAGFCGVFLLAQGVSTLAARWMPAVDEAFPALLATTQMVAQHSLLHIATALLALAALYKGGRAPRGFSIGFGLFYLALGVAGMAGGSGLCLGLKPFDHLFHILLGALGVLAFGISRRANPPGAQGLQGAPDLPGAHDPSDTQDDARAEAGRRAHH